jgi:hypothetical protein
MVPEHDPRSTAAQAKRKQKVIFIKMTKETTLKEL